VSRATTADSGDTLHDPRARDIRRRTLLRGAALAPFAGLTGLTAGCGDLGRMTGLGEFVRVAVSWSANELAAFQRVLDRRGTDDVALIPLGDDIGASLGASTTGRPNAAARTHPHHGHQRLAGHHSQPPLTIQTTSRTNDTFQHGRVAALRTPYNKLARRQESPIACPNRTRALGAPRVLHGGEPHRHAAAPSDIPSRRLAAETARGDTPRHPTARPQARS
jgi:hypothetical protein